MAAIPIDTAAWKKLLREVARQTRNSCDPEDFLHSAYLRLISYSAQHEVRNDAAFLVRTAVNIEIDNFRHQRLAIGGAERMEIKDDSVLQDEVIAARVRLERVREGLARLSPRTQEALLMRRLGGRGYDEIAVHLGVSRSTAERIVAKATTFLMEWTKDW